MTPAQQKILDAAKARRAAADAPIGHLQGLREQFEQGISLGSLDEGRAAFERATGKAGDYDLSMERQRRDRERYAAANPYKAGTAAALGAVAPVVMSYMGGVGAAPFTGGASMVLPAATTARALPIVMDAFFGVGGAGKVAAANTLRQGISAGAKAGATPGALEGYMSANPGQREYGAAQGAVVGSGLGGTIGGTSIALPRAMRYGRGKLDDINQYLAGPGNDPERGSVNVGGGPSTRTPRAPRTPSPAPATAAEAQIMQAMYDGNITQDQAIAAIARAQQLNVPVMLADVGGQPVQRLTRSVRTLTGPGSAMVDQAFETRARGGAGRVINAVERGVGARSTGNPAAVSDRFREQARTDSRPYYEELGIVNRLLDEYKDFKPSTEITNPDVLKVMSAPRSRDVIQAYEKTLRGVGGPVSPLYNPDGTFARSPTFEDVNAVKKVVQETIRSNKIYGPRPSDPLPAGTQTEVDAAQYLVNNLLRNADASADGNIYRMARGTYERPMQRNDAFAAGVEQFRTKGDFETLRDIETTPEAILPENLKYLRRGQVEALRQRIQSPNDQTSNPNRVAPIAGSINARAQLDAAALNANRRERMNERLALENQMSATSNYVRGGSNTADKIAEAEPNIIGDAVAAAPGGTTAVGLATAKGIGSAVMSSFSKETRAEIAGILTNMNPRQSIEFLERLKVLQAQGELTTKAIRATAAAATTSMNE
jgi:hypothetical protein